MSAAQGQRLAGGFILITGLDGVADARPAAVGRHHPRRRRVPGRDDCAATRRARRSGAAFGHTARRAVPATLDEVLAWFA